MMDYCTHESKKGFDTALMMDDDVLKAVESRVGVRKYLFIFFSFLSVWGIFVGIHDDGQTIKISACYTSFILFYESCLIPMYKTQIYSNFQF